MDYFSEQGCAYQVKAVGHYSCKCAPWGGPARHMSCAVHLYVPNFPKPLPKACCLFFAVVLQVPNNHTTSLQEIQDRAIAAGKFTSGSGRVHEQLLKAGKNCKGCTVKLNLLMRNTQAFASIHTDHACAGYEMWQHCQEKKQAGRAQAKQTMHYARSHILICRTSLLYKFKCLCLQTHTHTCKHTHTQARTHTHAHTHACAFTHAHT